MLAAALGLMAGMGALADAPGVVTEMLGLWAGFAAGPVARVTGNFSHADVDRDGRLDLLFDSEIWLRDAGPGWKSKIGFPETGGEGFYDLDTSGVLWVAAQDRLAGWQWDAASGAWEKKSEQEFPFDAAGWEKETGGGRRRFLHDLDRDGMDDLVLVGREEARWHRRTRKGFDRKGALMARLPAPQMIMPAQVPLWPPERRALALPARRLSCEVSLVGSRMFILYGIDSPEGLRWALSIWEAGVAGEGQTEEETPWQSPALPRDVVPVWLDAGGSLPGFARIVREAVPGTASMDEYVTCEVWETGDRAPRAFRRITLPKMALHPPLADLNRDGRLDVLLMTLGLTGRGMRERAQEMLTGNRLRLEVTAWMRGEKGYPPEPSWQVVRTLQLDAPPVRGPRMLEWAAQGQLVFLAGDFNGDGFADLMVRERMDLVACYPCGADGCAQAPLFTFTVSPDESVFPADVNGDGIADIVCVRPDTPQSARVLLVEGRPQ